MGGKLGEKIVRLEKWRSDWGLRPLLSPFALYCLEQAGYGSICNYVR